MFHPPFSFPADIFPLHKKLSARLLRRKERNIWITAFVTYTSFDQQAATRWNARSSLNSFRLTVKMTGGTQIILLLLYVATRALTSSGQTLNESLRCFWNTTGKHDVRESPCLAVRCNTIHYGTKLGVNVVIYNIRWRFLAPVDQLEHRCERV